MKTKSKVPAMLCRLDLKKRVARVIRPESRDMHGHVLQNESESEAPLL
jgi:hypothetical protein